jgi:hypothetical protein
LMPISGKPEIGGRPILRDASYVRLLMLSLQRRARSSG